MRFFYQILLFCGVFYQANLLANEKPNLSQMTICLLEQLEKIAPTTDIAELKLLCKQIIELEKPAEPQPITILDTQLPISIAKPEGAISDRFSNELKSAFNPHVITPHRMNYILPFTYTSSYNREVYQAGHNDLVDPEQKFEAKFQISYKVPLNYASLLVDGDALYVGVTLNSWWQVYSSEDSKPFRETNYKPEIFYYFPVGWQFLNTSTSMVFGLEHQSNGRSLPLSRSWNRIYMAVIAEADDWAVILRPWYRIPESNHKDLSDPNRDDNPDIADYMGHFELSGVYRVDQNIQTQFMFRQNFQHSRGAIELGFTYPLWGRLRGYVQYFNGYGESLIDYNHAQQRIGLGIALTDLL